MGNFRRWDRFDADAVEAEIERNAQLEQATRARVIEEQSVLTHCEARAAALKSEAAVRTLRAKRGLRRGRQLPPHSTDRHHQHQPQQQQHPPARHNVDQDPNAPVNHNREVVEGEDDLAMLAFRAKERANMAELLARGLRHALGLRDEAVALAEAGEVYRGVNKARQCLQELDLAERKLLHLSPPMAFKDNDTRGTDNTDTEPCAGSSAATVGDGSVGSKRSCCGEAASIPDSDSGARVAHDHSHHGYTHGHDHGGNHGQQRSVSTPSCEGASAAEHNSSISTGDAANVVNSDLAGDCEGGDAVKERERAMRVLRRARAMCRVAEGGCFLRKGRAAQATEVLRDLLLEDPGSVPAWVARGEAFVAMGIPLLAGLHFDRALALDPACDPATVHKENLRMKDAKTLAAEEARSGVVAVVSECEPSSIHARVLSSSVAGPSRFPKPSAAGEFLEDSTEQEGMEEKAGLDWWSSAETEGSARGLDVEHNEEAQGKKKEAAAKQADRHAVTTTAQPSLLSISASHSSTRCDGGGGGGDDCVNSTDTSARASALLAKACEEYRAGVVLHQEAFLMASSLKFRSVLSCLNQADSIATTATAPTVVRVAGKDKGEEGEAEADVPMVVGGDDDGGGKAILRDVRLGCHLNIAAAVLLRRRDYESAVEHCTRALILDPGNTRALVRRAQAHEALGFFRLAVEDLEAAEACLGEGMGEMVEVRKRLDHARWTKIHVGNGKDELSKVSGGRAAGGGTKPSEENRAADCNSNTGGGRSEGEGATAY